ncbi:hypothetical protein PTKIN_Ptkin15bG0008500 [Pterospermum kingtungense]
MFSSLDDAKVLTELWFRSFGSQRECKFDEPLLRAVIQLKILVKDDFVEVEPILKCALDGHNEHDGFFPHFSCRSLRLWLMNKRLYERKESRNFAASTNYGFRGANGVDLTSV